MSGYWRHPIVGYVTNLGYVFCVSHRPLEPGSCRQQHHPMVPIRDGWEGIACDWPGCEAKMPQIASKDYEYVDMSLHENLCRRD